MRLHRLFIDLDEGRANGLNAEQVMVLAAVRYLSRDTPWKRNNAELAEMLCSTREKIRRRLDELLAYGKSKGYAFNVIEDFYERSHPAGHTPICDLFFAKGLRPLF